MKLITYSFSDDPFSLTPVSVRDCILALRIATDTAIDSSPSEVLAL